MWTSPAPPTAATVRRPDGRQAAFKHGCALGAERSNKPATPQRILRLLSYGRFVLNLAFFIPAFRLGTRCARISIAVLCLAAVLIIGARNTEAQQTAVCSETPGTGERVLCTEDADSSKEIKLTLKGIDIDTTDDDTHSVAGHHEGSGRIFIDFQTGLDESGTGTLTDNDGTPTLTIADARATEGNPVEFTVTLDPASASDVTVEYATTDGTATANSTDPDGADYTAPTNGATLTISTGQTTGTISIATGNDNVDEDDETFTLTLSNPSSNAALGTEKTATGTIEDDDTDPAAISSIRFASTPPDWGVPPRQRNQGAREVRQRCGGDRYAEDQNYSAHWPLSLHLRRLRRGRQH